MKKAILFLSLTALLSSCSVSIIPSNQSSASQTSASTSSQQSKEEPSTSFESSIIEESITSLAESSTLNEQDSSAEESLANTSVVSSDESVTSIGDNSSVELIDSSVSHVESSAEETNKGAFDLSSSLNVQLHMSDAAMSFISNYQNTKGKYADAYIPADMTITLGNKSYYYEEVGVRQKGNFSRTSFYSGGEIDNPVHFKVSFKATFDDDMYDDEPLQQFKKVWNDTNSRKERKKRNFEGFEKLDFKYLPRNNGQCLGREIYAYKAFEEAGIFAPKARTCTFSFGDESYFSATYEMIETIDKAFFTRRLGKDLAKGDLYKCVYNVSGKADFSRNGAVEKTVVDGRTVGQRMPNGKIGVEDAYHQYFPSYQLKTNDDLGEGADFSKMSNLINTLWNCLYAQGSKAELESAIDVDQFLKFSAISYLMGNPDDQRYNNNNYYIYFMPDNGKAIFLPYDWDWSLGADWESSDRMAVIDPFSTWTLDNEGVNNLYRATFLPMEGLSYDASSYSSTYLSYVKSHANKVLDSEKYASLIAELGLPDDENESVSSYMSGKKAVISAY